MYREMYLRLFNAVTDALAAMEEQNFGCAKEALIAAQQRCEEMYLKEEET